MSLAFRKANPFCRMCEQEGRMGLASIADHILPREEYPDLAYEWENLQGLCRHHDGVKQAMEVFAREKVKAGEYDSLDVLREWCSGLEKRPLRFRPGDTT